MAAYKSFQKTIKSPDWMHVENEDSLLTTRFSFFNDTNISVFAVADGMGGLKDGRKTSRRCVKRFIKSLYDEVAELYDAEEKNFTLSHYCDRLKEAVDKAFAEANRAVCQAAPGINTGTTLSAAVLIGDYLLTANIGDSPILYYEGETKTSEFIGELQTLAEKEAAMGKYERFSAQYFSRDYVVTHFIGEYDELPTHLIAHHVVEQIHPGDSLFLGSDGAIGTMLPDEVFRVLQNGTEQTALSRLFERAAEDKDDDRTGILVEFM